MNTIEQDLILFFKLYFLAHKANYIDYMQGAKVLSKWFDFTNAQLIELDNAPVYCGNCFNVVGNTIGGGFILSCANCRKSHNLAYEIQELCHITGLNWYLCTYLMIRAIEDMCKSNNVSVFKNILYR